MDARPSGKCSFATTPATQSINGVNEFKCRGEILEFVPPRLLVDSWIANGNDKPESVTVVRWDLTPIPGGTRVKVTHSGLAQQPTTRELYRGGWPGVIQNLQKYLERRARTMSTVCITPDQDVIVAEIQIAVPPDRVFQAST